MLQERYLPHCVSGDHLQKVDLFLHSSFLDQLPLEPAWKEKHKITLTIKIPVIKSVTNPFIPNNKA